MALCLKYFCCFGLLMSVVLSGTVFGEVDAMYKFLSWKLDDVLAETRSFKVKIDNIDNRVKTIEEKLQGVQTTTPNSVKSKIEDEKQEIETNFMEYLEIAVWKMLSKEKMLLRQFLENIKVAFAELKSEIKTQMTDFNASLKDAVKNVETNFDNLKSEIKLEMSEYNNTLSNKISAVNATFEINLKDMYKIVNNKSDMLMNGSTELRSDWNSTTRNISQILRTMNRTMVSNIEAIETRMIADVKREQSETLQSISTLKGDVNSLSANIATLVSVLSNRISSESSALSSRISSISSLLSSESTLLSSNISSLSSSLSTQMSSISNRIYRLEERIDECASNPCPNNATCVDHINSYSCLCVSGYHGKNCQSEIDECGSSPCKNGATCNDHVNGYTCVCASGWSGTQCSQTSHYGTDFYIGMFPSDDLLGFHNITIDIASKQEGNVVLSVPYLNINQNSTIKRGATTLTVSPSILKGGTFIETRGMHIKTNVPVALFVTRRTSDVDTYLALPFTALGTSYKVASYKPYRQYPYAAYFSIIGIRENTKVSTTFRNQRTTISTFQPFSVGQHESKTDLSDTYIESDQIVAVISGASGALIPHNVYNDGYLLEQMVPIKHWDRSFIVSPIFPKQGSFLKILTIQHEMVCLKNSTNTICNFASSLPDEGILIGTKPVVVTSAAPISVIQFGIGQRYDSIDGGPFMTVIPAVGSYLNEYYFVIPYVYYYVHPNYLFYLSIIVPSSQSAQLYLDGSSLSVKTQYDVPDPFNNYTVIIANIGLGYHRLWHADSNVKFGATIYGLTFLSGVGFPVGFAFTNG